MTMFIRISQSWSINLLGPPHELKGLATIHTNNPDQKCAILQGTEIWRQTE